MSRSTRPWASRPCHLRLRSRVCDAMGGPPMLLLRFSHPLAFLRAHLSRRFGGLVSPGWHFWFRVRVRVRLGLAVVMGSKGVPVHEGEILIRHIFGVWLVQSLGMMSQCASTGSRVIAEVKKRRTMGDGSSTAHL